MKRRDMLSLLAMGTTPFIFKSSFGNTLTSPMIKEEKILKRFGDGRDWFFEKRYGMFVHWGIYSIPAWHEQYQWRAKIQRQQYVKFADEFNPEKFNPNQWLDLMQEAGMKYITFTTKHHDGFCMWDTKQTKFNVMNTPYKKDILGMLADACHKRNVPLCLYYSIADWNHINYPNLGRHHELEKPEPGDQPDWNKYMRFLKAQIKELCSNYGEIHGIWWDMNVPEYYDPSVNAMIRKLQPKAIINNRGFDEGDYGTPERDEDKDAAEAPVFRSPTEACQSVDSLSWGYKKDAEYFTDRYLINSIDRYFSAGANYLLNVGPTNEGLIPLQPTAILKRIGKWYTSVKESFENVQSVTQLVKSRDVSITRQDQIFYIHFNKELLIDGYSLKPINILPVKASLLNDGRPVECVVTASPEDYPEPKKFLRLKNLPINELPNTCLIVKLEFNEMIM
jgi:alpha-L-fucosidase